jgi:hypothetical protein
VRAECLRAECVRAECVRAQWGLPKMRENCALRKFKFAKVVALVGSNLAHANLIQGDATSCDRARINNKIER